MSKTTARVIHAWKPQLRYAWNLETISFRTKFQAVNECDCEGKQGTRVNNTYSAFNITSFSVGSPVVCGRTPASSSSPPPLFFFFFGGMLTGAETNFKEENPHSGWLPSLAHKNSFQGAQASDVPSRRFSYFLALLFTLKVSYIPARRLSRHVLNVIRYGTGPAA